MSGTTDYTYTLLDANGQTDTITVTVDDAVANTSGAGPSQTVVGISGNIDGQTIAGEAGTAGVGAQLGNDLYDNAIFQGNGGFGGGNIGGIDNYGLEFTTADGTTYNLYDDNGTLQLIDSNGNFVENLTLVSTDAPCFCAGTMISTDRGEVPVEALSIGDTVLTADGAPAPIRWIGRRIIASRFADPVRAMPVRIAAGAFDENMPVRDTLVSQCHALLVDGLRVQAGALVNGANVTRERTMPEFFTYYHIELADHALILANGMPAETFVDNVDRMGFDNWAEHEALFGADTAIPEMAHPRAKSARQVPSATRSRLLARAGQAMPAAA